MPKNTTQKTKSPSQKRKAVDKYAGIYFNETTQRYDVKYNYKVYDPDTGKNKYKQKWKYNLRSLEEAKSALAGLRNGGIPVDDKEITLEGIYKVWLKKAEAGDLSVNSIRNTESQLKIIYEFLPKETKLKNITGTVYDDLFAKLRAKELDKGGHYSEETLHSVDSCLHKLMKLAWKRDLIEVNPLAKVDRMKFDIKSPIEEDSDKIVTKEEFYAIAKYFEENKFVRKGIDRYKGFNAMVRFMYFTGCRIGEVLAVTYNDIQRVHIDKNGKRTITIFDYPDNVEEGEYDSVEVKIDKVRLSSGVIEEYEDPIKHRTKNKKKRRIPLNLFSCLVYIEDWWNECGRPDYSTRIFDWTDSNARTMIQKACEMKGIQKHSCHDFRHTFISNLMADPTVSLADVEALSGDKQETILARYSHMLPEARQKFELATDNW